MQCISMINRFKFASGADEKVLRIFEAPRNFIDNFSRISQLDFNTELEQTLSSDLPEGASVPALGLSNKAIYPESNKPQLYNESDIQPHPNEQYTEVYFKAVHLDAPPTEENLLQNTLWPETQKLYGHGYEVFSVACNPQGTMLASTCKAAKAEHASIILWDTSTWRQICHLESHNLTVTQLAFSNHGRYLLSVSRDRTWSLFKASDHLAESEVPYCRVAHTDKKSSVHSRIIWSCAWTPDDLYFLTASRDKKVIAWGQSNELDISWGVKSFHEFPDSVTAVDIAPIKINNSYVVGAGLDNGFVYVYLWKARDSADTWRKILELNQNNAHHMTVKRLKFRKQSVEKQSDAIQLASCGADHVVRIYNIYVDKL